MHWAADDTTTLAFIAGALAGFVAMIAILTIRRLAAALVVLLMVAILGAFILDGPMGFGRWLALGETFLIANAALISGFSVGKLLASIVVTAVRPSSRVLR